MTENEAIKDIKRQLWEIDSDDADITLSTKSLKMAIQALEEIQQYREIGTVEELQKLKGVITDFPLDCGSPIKSIAEIWNQLKKYLAIGTIDEFKDLKENQFFNFDSPVARIDKKSYDKAIDDLCNEFHKNWEEQCENDMEDCINWYDWLIACAKQLKGEKQ